ncbi:MAG: hypothetical protein DRP01_03960 [Archaeoglobales archaeon]|nr:MAG: hypothetical protein DRP01_03960 [Archaeoglobales archaeon]
MKSTSVVIPEIRRRYFIELNHAIGILPFRLNDELVMGILGSMIHSGITSGHKAKTVISACVYLSAKLSNIPVTQKYICDIIEINRIPLVNVVRKFLNFYDIEIMM